MDLILRLALLQYITTTFAPHPAPIPAGVFPIASSTFMGTILSLRPHWAPTDATVAKSSFKKAGKWLKAVSPVSRPLYLLADRALSTRMR